MLWWTIVVAVVLVVLVAAVSFYIATVLVAREELDEAALGITIAALAVTLAVCYVMLLPLEVALLKESNDLVASAMSWVWTVTLTLCLLFACTLVPFGMIWYESLEADDTVDTDDGDRTAAACPARRAGLTTAVIDFVIVAVFFLLWLAIGVVDRTTDKGEVVQMRVPLTDFLIALTTAAGWTILFAMCGAGFAAVPIEGMRAFVNRPRAVTAAEYEITRSRIHSATSHLLEAGRALDAEVGSANPSRSQRRRLAAFRQQVRDLESMHTNNETAYRISNASALRQYVKLTLSVVAAFLSTAWVLHIILYDLAKSHAFLNTILVALDGVLPLLGSSVYAIFAFYLMWCTVFGCMTIGGNLLAFLVFPMRRGGTMVNALLFNALLIILAALAALHLCATSFDVYAKDTYIVDVFARYADNITGISQLTHYLPYGLVLVSMTSVPWLLLCPRRRAFFGDANESDEDFTLL